MPHPPRTVKARHNQHTVQAGDWLDIAKLNALPQPLRYLRYGDKETPGYYIDSICVETGLCRINVAGRIGILEFVELKTIIDGNSNHHDTDQFWIDQ